MELTRVPHPTTCQECRREIHAKELVSYNHDGTTCQACTTLEHTSVGEAGGGRRWGNQARALRHERRTGMEVERLRGGGRGIFHDRDLGPAGRSSHIISNDDHLVHVHVEKDGVDMELVASRLRRRGEDQTHLVTATLRQQELLQRMVDITGGSLRGYQVRSAIVLGGATMSRQVLRGVMVGGEQVLPELVGTGPDLKVLKALKALLA